jgi:hypothetical protein
MNRPKNLARTIKRNKGESAFRNKKLADKKNRVYLDALCAIIQYSFFVKGTPLSSYNTLNILIAPKGSSDKPLQNFHRQRKRVYVTNDTDLEYKKPEEVLYCSSKKNIIYQKRTLILQFLADSIFVFAD